MLYSHFYSKEFKRAAQSGFYFDFFLKNIFEIVVRNVLIYSAQFFCEKYVIEYFSKKVFVNITYYLNFLLKSNSFEKKTFFVQIVTVFFYFGTIYNIVFFLFI